MVEKIQHHPQTKQQIKNALYSHLYSTVNRHFRHRLDTLIVRNTLTGGHSHKSFVYKNNMYSCDQTAPPKKMNRLQPEYHPEMDTYLLEVKQLNEEEIPYVIGFINQVLNSTNELSDYYRLLPEAVHGPIREIIASCPCHTTSLPEEAAASLRDNNKKSITMMRKRMVINLLI